MKIYQENVNVNVNDQTFLLFVSKTVNNNLEIISVCSENNKIEILFASYIFGLTFQSPFRKSISDFPNFPASKYIVGKYFSFFIFHKNVLASNNIVYHGMISFKQIISITEVFNFKTPRLGFSFLSPVSFEIIQCRFFQSDFHLSS